MTKKQTREEDGFDRFLSEMYKWLLCHIANNLNTGNLSLFAIYTQSQEKCKLCYDFIDNTEKHL